MRACVVLAVLAACGRVGFDDRPGDGPPGDAAFAIDAVPDAIIDALPSGCAALPDGTACDDNNACTGTSTCASGTCVPDVPMATCQLADSMAQFADAQGANGWFYGYYRPGDDADGTYDPASDFQALAYLDEAWRPPDYAVVFTWAYAMAWGGHPAIAPSLTLTVRRWVSPVAGPANAVVAFSKSDTSCGDGVTGTLVVDGTTAWSQSVAFDDGEGVTIAVPITLHVGTTVDFMLAPGEDEGCDTSDQGLVIEVP